MNGAGFYRSDALFVAQSMHWRKLSTGGNWKNRKFILSWYIYWVLKEGMPHLHDGSLMPTHQYSKWEFFSITWCSTLYFPLYDKKGKGSPYSITKRRVPELIPVLCSQPAGDVSHKPGSRLPLLSARSAATLATLKRAATNFAAWWTEARWVRTVCLRLLTNSVAAAILTQAILRGSLTTR